MRVLIGCERFGVLREAFRGKGHDAWSCDLVPAVDDSQHHIQGDVFEAIKSKGKEYYDLIILHPDCTHLTVAGNHVYAAGKPKHHKRLESITFTENLWNLAKEYCGSVVLENPKGVLSTQSTIGKAHYIQPFEYGEDASKLTGLWLHNVSPLKPTKRFTGRMVEWPKGSGKIVERWSNQTDSGQNKLAPSAERAMLRAKTYPGIAKAMADQWGGEQ